MAGSYRDDNEHRFLVLGVEKQVKDANGGEIVNGS